MKRYCVQVIDDSIIGDDYEHYSHHAESDKKEYCIVDAKKLNKDAKDMFKGSLRYRVYDTKLQKVIYSIRKRLKLSN